MASIGRYEILGEVAIGGMAEILLGRLSGPSGFERVVVVKRILRHLARRPQFIEMFLDEARTVARLRHPNVVQVHELGEADGELFLVMEYLEGESLAGLLRRLVARGERLDPWLAAYVVAEACRGLHAAHELSDGEIPLDLVHRDVSPQNLFLTYDGAVKVIDFGIAKVADGSARTEAGQVKGKLAYMSPEQCAGKALDRRTDVFAAGAVLWEALTATQLFRRSTDLATLKAICELPVPPPSTVEPAVPAALDAVAMRALQRRHADRYESAAAMRGDLLSGMGAMGRVGDAGEALAALMRRLFADRVAEKAEMLRRASTPGSIASVPAGECDLTVDLPAVDEVDATRSVHTVAVPRSPRPWVARAGAAMVVLAVASGAAWTVSRDTPSSEAPPTSAAPPAAAAEPPASVDAAPAPHATASAATVVLHVQSTPPGAKVKAGDVVLGTTPFDAAMPRGAASVELSFELAGHVPLTLAVVPGTDQRLVTTLQPLPPPQPVPRPNRAAPRPAPAGGIEKLP